MLHHWSLLPAEDESLSKRRSNTSSRGSPELGAKLELKPCCPVLSSALHMGVLAPVPQMLSKKGRTCLHLEFFLSSLAPKANEWCCSFSSSPLLPLLVACSWPPEWVKGVCFQPIRQVSQVATAASYSGRRLAATRLLGDSSGLQNNALLKIDRCDVQPDCPDL